MNDDWPFDMPKELAYKVIEELDWMVHNYCLDQFSCDWLLEMCKIMLEKEKDNEVDN